MTDIESWADSSFESKYQAMAEGLSEKDIKKNAENVLHICMCAKCPTNCLDEEINAVYCTFGKNDTVVNKNGCMCKDCGIAKTMSMRWEYYCINGTAVELSDL